VQPLAPIEGCFRQHRIAAAPDMDAHRSLSRIEVAAQLDPP
jgi:hypothetical protein